ncbi:MAG: S-layer protein, partial [Thermococcus sp.]|nr:S-layer protein [Thermococcus sp.]
KEHEAVKYIREVLDESLPYYSRDSAMMDLGGRLALLDYLPNETNLGGLKPLAEFANESNFMKFYKAHREDYLEYTSSIAPYLENVPELHRKFFGFTHHEYCVELSYSVRIHDHVRVRGETVYCIGYALPSKYKEPMFQQVTTTFHEFTHPPVEDFLGENFKFFENKSYYLDEVRNQMPVTTSYDYDHFGSFSMYLDEILTESLAEYFALKSGVPEDFVEFRSLQMSTVLYPIQDFLGEYEHFEETRKENETLFDYAPIMAEHMGKWATPENISEYFKMRTPITGGWAADRIKYMGKVIIVYGTQNPDKSGTEYDRETAEEYKRDLEKFFILYHGSDPEIIVKADVNLTENDLKENLILIGGPVANKITRELNDKLPITFVRDENGWSLKRNPGAVKDFHAFLVANGDIMKIPLDSTIPYDGSIGALQTIRNPWNEKNFIIVLAGLTRYGTRNILRNPGFGASYIIFGNNYTELGFYKQYTR